MLLDSVGSTVNVVPVHSFYLDETLPGGLVKSEVCVMLYAIIPVPCYRSAIPTSRYIYLLST